LAPVPPAFGLISPNTCVNSAVTTEKKSLPRFVVGCAAKGLRIVPSNSAKL